MRINRALTIRDNLKTRLFDDVQIVIIGKLSNERLTSRYLETMKQLPANSPQWLSSYLEGYFAAKREELYKYHLGYYYRVKGQLYSANSADPDYYGKHGIKSSFITLNHCDGGHYWKGTDKKF